MTAVLFSDAAPVASRRHPSLDELTARDLEVLPLLAEATPVERIAEQIGARRHQVKDSIAHLARVLHARGQAGIVAQGYRCGLLRPEGPVPDGRGIVSREQYELLLLIARGMGDREAGEALGVGYDTARSRVGLLFRALGARGRGHAVKRAVDLGVLRLVPRGAVS